MKRHLLPCPCSHRIEIAAAQAGGTVRCPDCGRELAVPRLGELSRLETVTSGATAPSGRDWGGAQACLLVGLVVAIVAAATAGWLRGRRAGAARADDLAITESFVTAAVDRVHEKWLALERQGIARPPRADELRRVRQAESFASLERIAWVTAAAGVGLAAAAAPFVAARRR